MVQASPLPESHAFVPTPQGRREAEILHQEVATAGLTPQHGEKKIGKDLFYKLLDVRDSISLELLYQEMAARKGLGVEQKNAGYFSRVTNLIMLSKTEGAKVALGYFFYTGVLTLGSNLRIRVDFEKMPTAVVNLAGETLSALEEESQDKAKAVLAYVQYIPQDWLQKISRLTQ